MEDARKCDRCRVLTRKDERSTGRISSSGNDHTNLTGGNYPICDISSSSDSLSTESASLFCRTTRHEPRVMLWPEKDELYALKTLTMSLSVFSEPVFSACVISCTLCRYMDLLVLNRKYMISLSFL